MGLKRMIGVGAGRNYFEARINFAEARKNISSARMIVSLAKRKDPVIRA